MWQEFFGRGIVRTSEDFGTQGEKPTHPELLDWLASEFRDTGWSMKRMHRLIVTSATYRQSSKVRNELKERDPENTLISRQSRLRLPAELVRDAALAVERSAEHSDRRAERTATAACRGCGTGIWRIAGSGPKSTGAGPVPARLVHPLPAHGAVSAADELRRAGFERRLHAAIAVEYAAAGSEFVERSCVLRIGAGVRFRECFRKPAANRLDCAPSGWCWAAIRLRANESDSENP